MNPFSEDIPSHPSRRIIHGHTLYSTHLQEDRTIKVVLPPNTESVHSLPVIYCHDGGEFLTHGRLATLASGLMDSGAIQPMAIVAIHVNKAKRTDDYAPEGARNPEYNRFVVEECLPFIEARYPISRQSSQRFMTGVSLGGAASMTLHLEHPDLFSQLMLFSGAFYEAAMARIQAAPFLDDLSAWMIVGTDETTVETSSGVFDFYHLNHQARDLLFARGADIDYVEAEGSHLWGFWQRHIPDALRWADHRLRKG